MFYDERTYRFNDWWYRKFWFYFNVLGFFSFSFVIRLLFVFDWRKAKKNEMFIFLLSFLLMRGKKLTLQTVDTTLWLLTFFSPPGKDYFTIKRNNVSNSSHSVLPLNHIGLLRQHQAKKIQNYLQFRCAATQRVNNFFSNCFSIYQKTNRYSSSTSREILCSRKKQHE
jgi:hypothetical protein